MPVAPEAPEAANLAVSAAATLRQRLASGHYAPGQRLSERALGQELGISRNTLREAFRLLTQESLLTHAPHRGVSVAVPDAACVADIYRLRRMIECSALAGARAGHPALTDMRRAVQQAMQHQQTGHWPGVGTSNIEFHRAIVSLADSPRLNAWFARLLAELRLAFGLLHDAERLHAPYVQRNQSILALAEEGRFAAAARQLQRYLRQSEQVLLDVRANPARPPAAKAAKKAQTPETRMDTAIAAIKSRAKPPSSAHP